VRQEARDPFLRARGLKLEGDILGYWLDQPQAALEAYQRALQEGLLEEERATVLFNLGMIHYQSQRYREAAATFQRYLEEFPSGRRARTARFILDRARRLAEEPPKEVPPSTEGSPLEDRREKEIRVVILKGAPSATLEAQGGLLLRLPQGERASSGPLRVELREGVIHLGGQPVPEGVEVESRSGRVRVEGRPYRGVLILRKGEGGLLVLNRLGLDAYLKGVVPKEMSASWPLEALKAQAVAARTYALYQMEKRRDYDYHVDSTILSQVYGGAGAEREASSRAVEETRGEVLTYRGRPIVAYFHAHSGGFTEDAGSVWGVSLPYLRAVRDPYSPEAQTQQWGYSLSLSDLSARLQRGGVAIGTVRDILLVGRSASGRIEAVRVIGPRGDSRLSGNSFRLKIGPGEMRSTLADLRLSGGTLQMSGQGFGHGVGMSQWGAYVMAKRGMSYREILSFYYPGTLLGHLP
jgi:stage II sporulation protein D